MRGNRSINNNRKNEDPLGEGGGSSSIYVWSTVLAEYVLCMYVWSSHIAEYGSTG